MLAYGLKYEFDRMNEITNWFEESSEEKREAMKMFATLLEYHPDLIDDLALSVSNQSQDNFFSTIREFFDLLSQHLR